MLLQARQPINLPQPSSSPHLQRKGPSWQEERPDRCDLRYQFSSKEIPNPGVELLVQVESSQQLEILRHRQLDYSFHPQSNSIVSQLCLADDLSRVKDP